MTVGVGENPLLAKLALDNGAKHSKDFIAEWRYEDVQEKVWGIDRSFLGQKKTAAKIDKSIGNSQVLPRDYTRQNQLELVLREIVDQVASRLRSSHLKTACISLSVGYSKGYIDSQGRSGWRKQMKIPLSNNTKVLSDYIIGLFRTEYNGQDVRHVGISYSKLVQTDSLQLDLFSDPDKEVSEQCLDFLIDTIRKKYGFKSLIHASSLLEGATAVSRSGLVAGHAGGNVGVQS